jgi:ABC-type multidrug transport system ATPase subunit
MTTHLMDDAEHTADDIAIMNQGAIVARGSLAELQGQVRSESAPAPDLNDIFIHFTGSELLDGSAPAARTTTATEGNN